MFNQAHIVFKQRSKHTQPASQLNIKYVSLMLTYNVKLSSSGLYERDRLEWIPTVGINFTDYPSDNGRPVFCWKKVNFCRADMSRGPKRHQ